METSLFGDSAPRFRGAPRAASRPWNVCAGRASCRRSTTRFRRPTRDPPPRRWPLQSDRSARPPGNRHREEVAVIIGIPEQPTEIHDGPYRDRRALAQDLAVRRVRGRRARRRPGGHRGGARGRTQRPLDALDRALRLPRRRRHGRGLEHFLRAARRRARQARAGRARNRGRHPRSLASDGRR